MTGRVVLVALGAVGALIGLLLAGIGLVLLVLIVPVAIAVFMAAYAVAEFAQGSHAPVGAPSLLVSVGQLLAVACAAVCGVRFARSRSPRSR